MVCIYLFHSIDDRRCVTKTRECAAKNKQNYPLRVLGDSNCWPL